MRYLLDTQILIWWFEGSSRLPKRTKEIMEGKSVKMVSVASFWEIVIKTKIKKLKLKKSLDFLVKNLEFEVLNINLEHVLKIGTLKDIHKDPFDRILISQAKVEDCELLTSDDKIKKYF